MLEVTAGGGGTCPSPLDLPLGVWVLCYRTKRDACYIVSGHCLFIYDTAAPPRRQFLHWISLSTFDWNIRYQLLIETFGVEIWLKLLIAFRCQLLTETFDSISLSTFDSDSLSTFDSNSLSTFDYHRAVEPSSALLNSKWFVSKVRFESCCLNLIAFRV